MEDPKHRRRIPFEELEPGTPLGEYRYTLTPDRVERHLIATDQLPYPDAFYAPVSIVAADGVNLAVDAWDTSSSVHAAQSLEVLALPQLGDTLVVGGQVAETYVRKGRRYVISRTVTRNESGTEIARGDTTGVIVYSDGEEERSSASKRSSEKAMSVPSPSVRLGPLTRHMTLEKMVLYEPPGERNMHTHDEVAREVGLPAAIATGTQFMAYVFDLLFQSYGFESIVGTRLDAKIRLPVFAKDRIETWADVTDEGEQHRELSFRCTTDNGDVIRGFAQVPKA